MRLAALAGKEIININSGSRLGLVAETDAAIDPATGQIRLIILPRHTGPFRSRGGPYLAIPWETVKKIGEEVIIVDFAPDTTAARKTRNLPARF